jgi:GT2 family glycosyltransferase
MNRRETVCAQIKALRELTTCPFELVICDDGSTDGTPEMLREAGGIVLSCVNRGIAWNKNRGIFYIMAVCGCDVAILLDDDVLPTEAGWQNRFVEAACRHGHVNFVYPHLRAAEPGPHGSELSTILYGCCIAFHRYAWSMTGYMDPRFRRYGHEHTEYTDRFIRNGFGGLVRHAEGKTSTHYIIVSQGITLAKVPPGGTPEDVAVNTAIWIEIQRENGHTLRAPWRDDRERQEFLAEIRLGLLGSKINLPYQEDNFV